MSPFNAVLPEDQIRSQIEAYKRNPKAFTPRMLSFLQQQADASNVPFDDGAFDISDSIQQAVAGVVEGFTTISIKDQPTNEYEAIIRNVGHLVGFAPGILAGPAKLAGASSKTIAKIAALGEASIPMRGAKFATGKAKSLVTPAVQRALKGRLATSKMATDFLKSGRVAHMAEGAFHLGTASAISSWKGGIEEMAHSLGSGAVFGGAFRAIGNLALTGDKTADVAIRTVAGSMFQGLQSTLQGDTTPTQVYNYLMGAYFGGKETNWKEAATNKFVVDMREKATNDPVFRAKMDPRDIPEFFEKTPELQTMIMKRAHDTWGTRSKVLQRVLYDIVDKLGVEFAAGKSEEQYVPENYKATGEITKEGNKIYRLSEEYVKAFDYFGVSGGATGADTAFNRIGKELNMPVLNYSFEGNAHNARKAGSLVRILTQTELEAADKALGKANATLGRHFNADMDNTFSINLLRRNYSIVKSADTIFAVGTLYKKGKARVASGGTGWGVQMAIDMQKPVRFFDQRANKWLQFDKNLGDFVEMSKPPKLTPRFGGIGSRDLQANGEKAIRDLMEKASTEPKSIKPSKSTTTERNVRDDTAKALRLEIIAENRAAYEKALNPVDHPYKVKKGKSTKIRKGGTDIVPAWVDHDKKIIHLDPEELARKFEDKAWTKPKVKGVKALSENEFNTLDEWVDFVMFHELSHIENRRNPGETQADYENRMNDNALTKMDIKKQLKALDREEAILKLDRTTEDMNNDTPLPENEPGIEYNRNLGKKYIGFVKRFMMPLVEDVPFENKVNKMNEIGDFVYKEVIDKLRVGTTDNRSYEVVDAIKEKYDLVLEQEAAGQLRQWMTSMNTGVNMRMLTVGTTTNYKIKFMNEKNPTTKAGNRKMLREPKRVIEEVWENNGGEGSNLSLLDHVTVKDENGRLKDISVSEYRENGGFLFGRMGYETVIDGNGNEYQRAVNWTPEHYNVKLAEWINQMDKAGYFNYGGRSDKDQLYFVKYHPKARDYKPWVKTLKADMLKAGVLKEYEALRDMYLKKFTNADAETHDKAFVSTVLYELENNGMEYSSENVKALLGPGFIKDAIQQNKRQAIWFTNSWKADKKYINSLLGRGEDDNFRYIITPTMKDKFNPNEFIAKSTEREEHNDGGALITEKLARALNLDGGFPESGQVKTFDVDPNAELGALLNKGMYHIVTPEGAKAMDAAGIDIIFTDTVSKQMGKRKITEMSLGENNEMILKGGEQYEIDPGNIRYNYSVKQDSHFFDAGQFPKQATVSVNEGGYAPFSPELVKEFKETALQRTMQGSEESNAVLDEYIVNPTNKNISKVVKNMSDISLLRVAEMLLAPGHENLSHQLYREMLKVERDTNQDDVNEGLIREEDANTSIDVITEFDTAVDRMTSASMRTKGHSLSVFLHKHVNDYREQVLSNYFVNRISKPKFINSGASRIRNYDMWLQKKFPELNTDDSLFMLGERYRDMPFKHSIKGLRARTLGEFWDKYNDPSLKKLRPEMEKYLNALVIRVPISARSALTKQIFHGFTTINDHGVVLHSRTMSRVDGADLDGDKIQFFFGNDKEGLKNSTIDAFEANKNEFMVYRNDKDFVISQEEYNSKSDVAKKEWHPFLEGTKDRRIMVGPKRENTYRDILTTVPEKGTEDVMTSPITKWMPLMRTQISAAAVDGRNMLGPAVVNKQILEATHTTMLKKGGRDTFTITRKTGRDQTTEGDYKWARYAKDGYEVSSQGDKRFSAFHAKLNSGETIEAAYQRLKGSGKGKPSIHKNFNYWDTYLGLWRQWAKENPTLLSELGRKAEGKTLTDKFANTKNNQARALATILGGAVKTDVPEMETLSVLIEPRTEPEWLQYQRELMAAQMAFGSDPMDVFGLKSRDEWADLAWDAFFRVKTIRDLDGNTRDKVVLGPHEKKRGLYGTARKTNNALYGRNNKTKRKHTAIERNVLLEEGVRNVSEEESGSPLFDIGRAVFSMDFSDNIIRRLDSKKLVNKTAEYQKALEELDPIRLGLNRKSLKFDVPELTKVAIEYKIFDRGEIVAIASNDVKFKKFVKEAYPKNAESLLKRHTTKEERLVLLDRARREANDFISKHITNINTTVLLKKLYDASEDGLSRLSMIHEFVEDMKHNSYLNKIERDQLKGAIEEVLDMSKESYPEWTKASLEGEAKEERSSILDQQEIDQKIRDFRRNANLTDIENKALDYLMLGSLNKGELELIARLEAMPEQTQAISDAKYLAKGAAMRTSMTKLGYDSTAIPAKSVEEFIGGYKEFANDSFTDNLSVKKGEEDKIANKVANTTPSYITPDSIDNDVMIKHITGMEGIVKPEGTVEIPKHMQSAMTELIDNVRYYGESFVKGFPDVVAGILGKEYRAMNFEDVTILNDYFKDIRRGSFWQRFFKEDTAELKKRYYNLFPEAVDKELSKYNMFVQNARAEILTKEGTLRTANIIKPGNIIVAVQDWIGKMQDQSINMSEGIIADLGKEFQFLSSFPEGEPLRQMAIQQMHLNLRQTIFASESKDMKQKQMEIGAHQKRYDDTSLKYGYDKLKNKRFTLTLENEEGEMERGEYTGEFVVDRIVKIYAKFNEKMYKLLNGDDKGIADYILTASDPETGDVRVDWNKFIKDMMSDFYLGKPINTNLGVIGLHRIGKSSLIDQATDVELKKELRNIKIQKEVGRFPANGYWPHLILEKGEITKLMSQKIKELNESTELTGKEKRKEYQKLVYKNKSLTGDWSFDDMDFYSSADALEAMKEVGDKKVISDEKMKLFNATERIGNMMTREYNLEGFSTDASAYETYVRNVVNVYFRQMSQILSRYMVNDFTKRNVHTMGTQLTNKWSNFLKLYIQGALGNAEHIPEYMLNDPDMKLKGTPYKAWSDSQVKKRMNGIRQKLGIGDKNLPEELQGIDYHQLRHWSNIEAQYELATLLAHPKTAVANVFGGVMHTVESTGLSNLMRARDIEWLSTHINPNWTKREDIWDFVVGHGILPDFMKYEIGLHPTLRKERNKEFMTELIDKFSSKTPDKKSLLELQKKYGISDYIVNVAAKFMSVPEKHLRQDAFMAHYVQAWKHFGGAIKDPNHPFLIEIAKKGVKATQFLYSAPFRPLFARSALGKVMTRFQLWSWNSVAFRNNINAEARRYGLLPGSEQHKRFIRTAQIDMFVFALANVFAYSLFEQTLPAPWNWLQDTSDWVFGDEKERDRAFFGSWPTGLAPLQMVTPPVARLLPGSIKALIDDDWSKLAKYQVYTMLPFGRIVRDLAGPGNLIESPMRLLEKTTGFPLVQLQREVSQARKEREEKKALTP